jgi:hypothetical protein
MIAISEPQTASRSDSNLRSRGRFSDRFLPPLFWATVGGFLVGGTFLFLQILNPTRPMLPVSNGVAVNISPSLRFDEDALLKVTQQHMAQRNYQSALSAAELVLRAHPDNARARRLADQASELLRSSAVYGGFLRAADQQDADTAAALYAELPADSPFRVNAWEPFMPVRNMFVTRHLNLANAAMAAGDCDLVSQQLDELHRITENERDPDLMQGKRLLTRCRRVFGAASAASAAAAAAANSDTDEAADSPQAQAREPVAPIAAKPTEKEAEKPAVLRDPFAHSQKEAAVAQADPSVEKPHKPHRRTPKPAGDSGSPSSSAPAASPPPAEKNLPSALRNPFGP